MCGIFFSICNRNDQPSSCRRNEIYQDISESLARRGPDDHQVIETECGNVGLYFAGWVLHMQGQQICSQPAQSKKGNILLWNGEVFDGLKVSPGQSDTTALLSSLDKCDDEEILQLLSCIEGPWSFVYYHLANSKVYFGRDYFGRRSLVWNWDENTLTLASVCSRNASWEEVAGCGIFCVNIKDGQSGFKKSIVLHPWKCITNPRPKVCEDFQTGRILNTAMHTKYKYKLDNYPLVDLPHISSHVEPLTILAKSCSDKNLWPVCREFIAKLKRSVMKRTSAHTSTGENCNIGVLFSGGVDCSVLALLADIYIPKDEAIDLLNVAFEQRRKLSKTKQSNALVKDNIYEVPDRITGRSSYQELKDLCPKRKWNFVEINVTLEELGEKRVERISMLSCPKSTVLDDSIACAIWFASRGEGLLNGEQKYRSNARVLLCGMGADEQLAGYSRHRGIYDRNNDWGAVGDEINMEVERISARNLGRDDRIISDHGKEARFPYFDEEVVQFLCSLPVHVKADLRLERGIGEKILLRGAAYDLGLHGAAVAPKRAIQFGSRIAKAENRKEKGGDSCERLKNNFASQMSL
uniref:asparagine synthetase domain-containing protein 1-like n=1 Tax=Ciona intestinalis TaxID=7719 RepID=UPI000180B2AC|nr:asparagine synthetase domain-containing protein 1-like [Ciona intestinalis]|eukprot:XP_002123378.1 asparagine synthetase domain-containing protein 1-like [Ciona intestinalis]